MHHHKATVPAAGVISDGRLDGDAFQPPWLRKGRRFRDLLNRQTLDVWPAEDVGKLSEQMGIRKELQDESDGASFEVGG